MAAKVVLRAAGDRGRVDVTARVTELVHGPDPALPLDEAALLIAAHDHRDLDVPAQLRRLDDLAAGVRDPTLTGLRRHLFGELGFAGAELDDYYDPSNSFLDRVLDRRGGIPPTPSGLLLEGGPPAGVA